MNRLGPKQPLTDEQQRAKDSAICMLDGCDRKYFSTGKCKLHYGKKWYIDNPEAIVHLNMKSRCRRPQHPEYKNYGGRGITVCERWRIGEGDKSGFRCFVDDMGKRPSPKHSIDRINPDGNYEPSNCRWATIDQQSINTRSIHSNNTTGYKGVYPTKNKEKWWAQIKFQNKRVYLGIYPTKEDAIMARKKAENKYYVPILEEIKL